MYAAGWDKAEMQREQQNFVLYSMSRLAQTATIPRALERRRLLKKIREFFKHVLTVHRCSVFYF